MGKLESQYMIAGALRRVWRNAGVPVDGTSGTFANVCEKGDLLIDYTNATLYQNTNTAASPTWTQKAASGVAIDTVVGNMAAAGTSTANAIGSGPLAAPVDHVHALGAHDHSGATKGGAVAMGVVGSMAAAGTATANAAGSGTTPAAIDHAHALGDHDHSGATKGAAIALAALAADFFTADATGRGKFQTDILDAATLDDLVEDDALTNAVCDVKFAASAFAADADSRAIFADGIWTAAKLAVGVLSADATGRALFAAGVFDAATALSAFADNSIPSSKVNWTYGGTANIHDIVPDDAADGGTLAYVAMIDHAHGIVCAAPVDGSLAAANAEGSSATSFSRADHAHRAVVVDSVEIEFGSSYDAVIGWEVGDGSNHTLVVGLADANQAIHFTDKSAIATDWNVGADTHPSVYVHSDSTPATDYLKLYHDATSGYVDVFGGSFVVSIAATPEYAFSATELALAANNLTLSTGYIQFSGAGYVDLGATGYIIGTGTVASAGVIRVANNVFVASARNAGDAADVDMIKVNASDLIEFGANLAALTMGGTLTLAAQQLSLSTGNVTVSGAGYIAMGVNPASAGYIRLLNTGVIAWRNAANGADINGITVDANDDVAVGADLQMGGNTILGNTAADGNLILSSTLHATKGYVGIPTGEEGLKVGGTADRDATVGTNAIHIFNGTAPAGALVNGGSFYCEGGEPKVMDAAGNVTVLVP